MKKYFLMMAIAGLTVSACANSGHNNHEALETKSKTTDTTIHPTTASDASIKPIQVAYANVNNAAGSVIRDIVNQYLAIKNALVSDNGADAARAATAMIDAMKKLDKSLLTAEQKIAYDKTETKLKEHATHIAANANKIEQQRTHFSMMSEEAYELIKNFGAGRPVYHDHCPMAMDNRGAMWISEVKPIKNPYFGATMLSCGSVEEIIQ